MKSANDTKPLIIHAEMLESLNHVTEDEATNRTVSAKETNDLRICDLNEYCLMDIFRAKQFDLLDLCSLAETCKHFKRIVQRIVPKHLSFDMVYENECIVDGKNYPQKRCRPEEICRVFKNFGSLATSVSISGYRNGTCNFLFDLIVTAHDNLKSLTIRNQEICHNLDVILKPVFMQLEKLYLDHLVSLQYPSMLLSGMDELVDLKIDTVGHCDAILEQTFSKLKRFDFRHKRLREANYETRFWSAYWFQLTNFISRHTRLITLKLNIDRIYYEHLDKSLHIICNSYNQLEELTLKLGFMEKVHIQLLNQLKSLRSLTISSTFFENFDCFSLLTLNELCVKNCKLPDDSNHFALLKHLTKLTIISHPSDNIDVVGAIKSLRNLEELSIRSFTMDEKTYLKIVEIVRERSKALKLDCQYNFKLNDSHNHSKIKLLQSVIGDE